MPKFFVFNSKELIKVLEKIGFQLDHSTGSHFVFYNPATKRRAVVPFHNSDLPKGTIASIFREAGVSKQEIIQVMKKNIKNKK